MKIYDITSELAPDTAVWPGDTSFSRDVSLKIEDGESVNLSSVNMSLHSGTHMDAPFHFLGNGNTIDKVPLEKCMGRAIVTTLTGVTEVTASDLESVLNQNPARVLFKFNPRKDTKVFLDRFTYFSEGAARRLSEAGVRLVGTDSPSVDAYDSKDLPAHHQFGRSGAVILENLVLNEVPDGEYELIALPLRIREGDGSPVRAVLKELERTS